MDMSRFKRPGAVCAGALLALAGGYVSAALVTINPVADNTIYQGTDATQADPNFEDNSCGAGTNLFSGETNDGLLRRALLRFDIAGAIPAGSTINSATLTLTVNRSGGNVPQTMTLRPVSRTGVKAASIATPAPVAAAAVWTPTPAMPPGWMRSSSRSRGTHAGGDFGPASASADVGGQQRRTGRLGQCGRGQRRHGRRPAGLAGQSRAPIGWELVGLEGSGVASTRRFSAREGATPPTLTIDFTPTGDVFACCFQDGACTVTDTASCTSAGRHARIPIPNSCGPNPCPQPTGACCNADESCSEASRAMSAKPAAVRSRARPAPAATTRSTAA